MINVGVNASGNFVNFADAYDLNNSVDQVNDGDIKYAPEIIFSEPEDVVQQRVIEVCQKGAQTLRSFLDGKDKNDQKALTRLDAFASSVSDKVRGCSLTVRQSFMHTVLSDFRYFCEHAQDLSVNTRRKEILNLAKGLKNCVAGQDMNIVTAANNVRVITLGIKQKFKNILEEFVRQHNLEFFKENNIKFDKSYEIHYGAFFHNRVRHYFELDEKIDGLMNEKSKESSGISYLSEELLRKCEQSAVEKITVPLLIDFMALECLDSLRNFYKNKYPKRNLENLNLSEMDEMFKDFKAQKELINSFGDILPEQIFISCAGKEEFYRLVSDKNRIAHQITKNLIEEKLFESKVDDQRDKKIAKINFEFKGSRYYKLLLSLEQLFLQDKKKFKKLFKKKSEEAHHDDAIKEIHEKFIARAAANLLGEMVALKSITKVNESPQQKQAQWIKKVDALFERAQSFFSFDQGKNDFFEEFLEKAWLSGRKDIVDHFFAKITNEQIGCDNKKINKALDFALRYQQKEFAVDLANQLTPEQLGEKNSEGNTALMSALIYGNLACATVLLQKMNIEQLCVQNDYGNVALNVALKYSPQFATLIIERLKELKAKPEMLNIANRNKDTPLMAAILVQEPEVALALIGSLSPEQLSVKGGRDRTAVIDAMDLKQVEPAEALIKKIDPDQLNAQDKSKSTALITSLLRGLTGLAKMIIEKLSPKHLSVQNRNGDTALIAAVEGDFIEVVKILVDKMEQKDLAAQDVNGNTALHIALQQRRFDIAKLLIGEMSKEQLQIKNNESMSVYEIAEINCRKDVKDDLYYKTHFFWSVFQ